MPYTVPTTDQLVEQNLSTIESKLNQKTPPVLRAFNKVLAIVLAMIGTLLFKFISDRILQVFALSASGLGLDFIGKNYGVNRQAAISSVLEARIVATNGTIIPSGTVLTSQSTNESYTVTDEAVASGGFAYFHVVAKTPGETGNLPTGEVLQLGTPIVGAESEATIVENEYENGLVTAGEDRESDAIYRRRILTRIRARGGGGNSSDYRSWAENTPDVSRAFPYSGKPVEYRDTATCSTTDDGRIYWINGGTADPFSFVALGFYRGAMVTLSGSVSGLYEVLSVTNFLLTVNGTLPETTEQTLTFVNESLPNDRTVYVESVLDPDVAPPDTLVNVKSNLLTDPATGKSRMPLGTTSERLYVMSTRRSQLRVTIGGMSVDSDIVEDAKDKIISALTDYAARVECFIDGLDYPGDRTDTISTISLSTIIQGILRGFGGSARSIEFDINDAPQSSQYQLGKGELLKMADSNPVVFTA